MAHGISRQRSPSPDMYGYARSVSITPSTARCSLWLRGSYTRWDYTLQYCLQELAPSSFQVSPSTYKASLWQHRTYNCYACDDLEHVCPPAHTFCQFASCGARLLRAEVTMRPRAILRNTRSGYGYGDFALRPSNTLYCILPSDIDEQNCRVNNIARLQ